MAESLAQSSKESIKAAVQATSLSNVYQESNNQMKALESSFKSNELELGFSSLSFQSTSNFRLSNWNKLLGGMILHFRMLHTKTGQNNTGTVTKKTNHFAYSLIQDVRYTMGGSELQLINGNSLLHLSLLECETKEKKDMLLSLSGAKGNVTFVGQSASSEENYYVWLPLPWSSLSGKDNKPLPIHLSDVLEISVTLKPQLDVLTNTDSTSVITKARMVYEYQKLQSQELYKVATIDMPYKYNVKSAFSHIFAANQNNNVVSIDLTGFRTGGLTDIIFNVINATDVTNFDSNEGRLIKNIKLEYNGQNIYVANDDIHQMWAISRNSTDNKYNSGNSYLYQISLAESDYNHMLKNSFVDGVDVSKQTLKLTFEIDANCRIYATYLYNAMFLFDGTQQVKYVM